MAFQSSAFQTNAFQMEEQIVINPLPVLPQLVARVTFDVPKDDDEVLLMFAQFVAADQVH